MNRAQFQLCLTITHRLQQHPAASPFLHPIDPTTHPNYSDIITDPVDLQTIESRLTDRSYRSVRQWEEF
jgi:hypothetical protein